MAIFLRLPMEAVNQAFQTLIELQIIEKTNEGFKVLNNQIHLDKHSFFANTQLINWRLKAIQEIPLRNKENLHYSAAYTLQQKDVEKIYAILQFAISDAVKIVKCSKEERLFVINVDWFSLL